MDIKKGEVSQIFDEITIKASPPIYYILNSAPPHLEGLDLVWPRWRLCHVTTVNPLELEYVLKCPILFPFLYTRSYAKPSLKITSPYFLKSCSGFIEMKYLLFQIYNWFKFFFNPKKGQALKSFNHLLMFFDFKVSERSGNQFDNVNKNYI